jgi:fibro-slime domain-containing protein
MECKTRMFYNGEQTSFRFQGDDDIWVFVNNRLLIDRGGCCSAATTEYIGPLNQDNFDLVKGKSYEVKIFFAERRGPGSTFIMSTNFELTTCRGGRWSKWSKCHKRRGIQSRHWETSKRRKPSRRSGVCPKLEKRPCPVDCKVRWKNWGKCDPVRGIRTRRHDIIQKPLNGGKACPLEKTKDCGYTLHVVWGKQVQTCSHSKNLEILNEHEMVKTVADICSTEFRVPQSNALNEPFNDIFELGASSHVSFVYEDVRSSKTRRVSLTRSYAKRSLACPAPSSASSDNYYFKVDNEDAPRVVTLCPSACNLVKNAAAGARRPKGTISFVFEPVVKLAALKVSGRGKRATKLFGPPRKLRPALTFPAKHPALQSLEVCSDPSRGKIRPIIPEYGVAGEDCNRIPGVDLFYDQHRKQTTKGVAHPHTSATPFARDVSDGISMFFFANALGETYFGMQIADEHAGLDDATGDYALVEVMLSGEALSKSGVVGPSRWGKTRKSYTS